MSTEPGSIIGFEAFERRTIKLRVPFDNLKNLCFSALGKALRVGARLPEAVLKTDHPQPSARELETLYRTLSEGLICSKERSELPRQRANLEKPNQPITIINVDALSKIYVTLKRLKNLCSPALAKTLLAGARSFEAVLKTDYPQPSAQEPKTLFRTLSEGLICSKERSELPRQQANLEKPNQPITIINADALNKICVTLGRLKNLCSPALATALLAGARSPEAVLKTGYPQPSAQELETLYRTLSEGLICSKERSELPRQQAKLEKPDQTITITIINGDALDTLRVSFDRLKVLCSPTLAKALAAGARLAGYKTLAEGLQPSELLCQQANLEKPAQPITLINADALDKLRVVIDRLKSFCSPVSVKALAVGARLR